YIGQEKYVRNPVVAMQDEAAIKQAQYNATVKLLVQKTGSTPAGAIAQIEEYRNNPSKSTIPIQLRGEVDKAINSKIDADNINIRIAQAKKDATKQLEGFLSKEVEEKLKGLPSIVLYRGGEKVALSNKEILD